MLLNRWRAGQAAALARYRALHERMNRNSGAGTWLLGIAGLMVTGLCAWLAYRALPHQGKPSPPASISGYAAPGAPEFTLLSKAEPKNDRGPPVAQLPPLSAFEEWHRKRQAATDKFDLREPFIKEYDGTAVDWPAVVALITPEFHALYIAPNKEAFQKFEVSYEKDYEALVMKLRKDDPIRVCARLDFSKDLGWSYPPIIKASLITRLISFDRWSQERKAMRDKQREFVERYDGMVVDWIGFVQDLSSRQSGDEICVNSSPFIKDDSHCDTIWVSAPRGLNLKPLVLKLDRIKVQGKRAFPNSQFWQAQIEGGTVQRLRGFSDSD